MKVKQLWVPPIQLDFRQKRKMHFAQEAFTFLLERWESLDKPILLDTLIDEVRCSLASRNLGAPAMSTSDVADAHEQGHLMFENFSDWIDGNSHYSEGDEVEINVCHDDNCPCVQHVHKGWLRLLGQKFFRDKWTCLSG